MDRPDDDLNVPETTYTFDRLIEAQAVGDLRALRSRGQDTLRLVLGDTPVEDLAGLSQAISEMGSRGGGSRVAYV